MKTILNIDDLYAISDFLTENGYTDVPLTVTIGVLTRERMNKINEELFYKYNTDKEASYFEVDEINVDIDNVKYKYVLIENGTHDNGEIVDK